MASLADKAILSGADNRPPMLEKDMNDSWKSRMELYMLNHPHGRMILESVEQGPLIWPSVEVEGVTRLKKYLELSVAEAIQADCDIKATNIILQGLPPEETEYAKLWNDWYKKCDECKYDKISYNRAYKDMQQKIERLQAQLGNLKGKSKDTSCVSDTRNPLSQKLENKIVELEFQVLNYARENAHLKTTYKSLFNSISVSQKEYFEQKIAILKDDLQKEESRNIDRELALEKEAQQLKPNLYDGSVIGKSDIIVVPDSENTLIHAEESRSKMIAKQYDPQLIEKKVITKPIDYATLNQLSTDFNTRFVPQTESYAEQAFWSQYSVQTDEPTHSGTTSS
nr:hypothetical protein [Tanacetum cinerariifolium]